jgi:PPM family protein phosphatase
MKVVSAGLTDIGRKRNHNEDSFLVDDELQLYVVADGMGGHAGGGTASKMAVETIDRELRGVRLSQDNPFLKSAILQESPLPEIIRTAVERACLSIFNAAQDDPRLAGMGTTVIAMLIHDNQAFFAHVGDSRAYLIRGNRVDQLTVDHSVAQALVASGVLSPEEARHSPWQHVLHKFLGCAEMTDGAEVHPFTPQAGDRLLLASDGLTNHVTDEDLRQGAKQFPDPQVWAEQLVRIALQRGSRDNVTCIVVAFDPE